MPGASQSPARILAARRRDASEEPREPEEAPAGQVLQEDGPPDAEAAPSPSSDKAAEAADTEPEAEAAGSPPLSFKGSPSAPSKSRSCGPSRSEYISRFVSRMRNAQIAMKCARHLTDWKRLHGCPQSSPVFICAGGYPDFTNAMRRRGWYQNEDKDSRFFDIKWAPAAAIDHDNLLAGQVVNHFHGNREITTKVGLTLNLRNCLPMCGADPDSFYPELRRQN
ncbi:TTLL3D [Symbiodinium natans]|uniref:TTLL3D protein n=1 Tax=Symbiodinium natans TaxID=878477 RepID=A0A812T5G2_9DINO|nr:TTLL3D [Symbiodinium natans]